jgi:hypothetical protein
MVKNVLKDTAPVILEWFLVILGWLLFVGSFFCSEDPLLVLYLQMIARVLP